MYIIYDDCDDKFLYAFRTLADAEEFILSIGEELDYISFLVKGKEKYLKELIYKYNFYTHGKMSLSGYALIPWTNGIYITEVNTPEEINSDFYIAYDLFDPDEFMYAFIAESEAEEFILSITEEKEYKEFCSQGIDEYFKKRKENYWKSLQDWLSLDGYTLDLNGHNYYVDKVKLL